MSKEFLTVSQLNVLIKDVLNMGFPQALWVCGEVQQYNRSKGKKHVFFQLVEKDPVTHDVKACIDLVIWEGRRSYIESVLKKSENAFELKDDIEVKFACRVDFYPPHGKVRLTVEDIDPTYTLGKIAQEKQRLIALLKEKGILDKNKQLALPLVPLNVGLITSDDSAAYNDFCSELKKSGFAFEVSLRNTIMQGKSCEADVCRGLDILSRKKDLDVIVITRGGGSISDLSCFDSRLIAEKIAAMALPVLSGIGHEIDVSVTDLAAHTFAKTPTAIAQFIVNQVAEFLQSLDEKRERIVSTSQDMIADEKQTLKDRAVDLQSGTTRFLKDHNAKMIRLMEFIKQRPALMMKTFSQRIEEQRKIFQKTVHQRFQKDKTNLEGLEKLIGAFHPASTLKRGFSITRREDGKILKDFTQIKLNDTILTEVFRGEIQSRVTSMTDSPKVVIPGGPAQKRDGK
ncbi:MAG: exodeoxyribonuclease VII large subunit [Candidatus Omnitrophica bacterium]|nr:exodeoxyribonuclease VII large subunit [Candidatus Omnitrophota bacterium]